MLMTERKAARTLAHLLAGGAAVMLVMAAAGSVPAQGQAPPPAPAQGQPPGPARGRGPGIQLPRQGFEATGQNPANYTPEEAAAVAVVKNMDRDLDQSRPRRPHGPDRRQRCLPA